MKRTEVSFSSSFSKIEINEKYLFIGSCFAENIGQKFRSLHLNSVINPFGVIFHPIPLFQLFNRALMNKPFEASDFFEFQDYWFNYEISGRCAKFEKQDSIDFANKRLQELRLELISANRLFLTFGSSILRKIEEKPVANCHKQSSPLFQKEISTSSEIREYIEPILKNIFKVNPNLKVLLSVSPIRHSKEGMVQNSLSKSNLIILCNEISAVFNAVEYIPIYEFVVDELRDYSFFEKDLVHPNKLGIDEVWEKLKKSLGSQRFIKFCNQSQKLLCSIEHESLYPQSNQNLNFQKKLLNSIIEHESFFGTNWQTEKKIIENRLK